MRGRRVAEDKTNFKGEANFYDLDEDEYEFKCEVPGTVNLKKPHKDYYKGSEEVEEDERSKDICYLQRV